MLIDSLIITKDNYGLNPFVQVFYSNTTNRLKEFIRTCKVLIPLFRSFILIRKQVMQDVLSAAGKS